MIMVMVSSISENFFAVCQCSQKERSKKNCNVCSCSDGNNFSVSFKLYDVDRDGFIDKSELLQMLKVNVLNVMAH